MEALQAIMTRRSSRKFLKKPVEEGLLHQVIEAGRAAPSGGNCQTTHFIVVRDPAVMEELALLVAGEFTKMEVTPGMYKSLASAITRSKAGGYRFHYDAPVLIITANQRDYGNNMADCGCTLENMMVAANALDMGSCWINQLRWLNENPAVLAYLEKLGLGEKERVYGGLALGWPDTADGLPARTPLPRTGNPVTFIG